VEAGVPDCDSARPEVEAGVPDCDSARPEVEAGVPDCDSETPGNSELENQMDQMSNQAACERDVVGRRHVRFKCQSDWVKKTFWLAFAAHDGRITLISSCPRRRV
jgi:hypothetical protein